MLLQLPKPQEINIIEGTEKISRFEKYLNLKYLKACQ